MENIQIIECVECVECVDYVTKINELDKQFMLITCELDRFDWFGNEIEGRSIFSNESIVIILIIIGPVRAGLIDLS